MRAARTSDSRWLLLVLLNSGFIQAGVYVVRPMITYRAVDLGADAALVGLVGSAFALAPLLFAIVMGKWVDRGRDGTALVIGSVVALVVTLGLIFLSHCRFIHRYAASRYRPLIRNARWSNHDCQSLC